MKTLISISLALLFVISCGSSNKKTYTLKDDNNGSKSLRVKDIITKTADNNKSNETITRYTYNEENLLISKKTATTTITYTYNKNKQLKTKAFFTGSIVTGSNTEYVYEDLLDEKTKLPVIDTIIVKNYTGSCVYKHQYLLNASNHASSIDKISEICDGRFGHSENPNYNTDFPKNEDKIYTTNLSEHTEHYRYFSQTAIATYDKGLRKKVEYYSPDETNASKAPVLTHTSEYTYENKPYFFKEYLSPMVFLPH